MFKVRTEVYAQSKIFFPLGSVMNPELSFTSVYQRFAHFIKFHKNIKSCNVFVDKNTGNKVMGNQYYVSVKIVIAIQI